MFTYYSDQTSYMLKIADHIFVTKNVMHLGFDEEKSVLFVNLISGQVIAINNYSKDDWEDLESLIFHNGEKEGENK